MFVVQLKQKTFAKTKSMLSQRFWYIARNNFSQSLKFTSFNTNKNYLEITNQTDSKEHVSKHHLEY